jgi:hypothetical protein
MPLKSEPMPVQTHAAVDNPTWNALREKIEKHANVNSPTGTKNIQILILKTRIL